MKPTDDKTNLLFRFFSSLLDSVQWRMLTLIDFTNRLLRSSLRDSTDHQLISIPTDPSQTGEKNRSDEKSTHWAGPAEPKDPPQLAPQSPAPMPPLPESNPNSDSSCSIILLPSGRSDHPQLAEANISFKEPWKFSPAVENWGTAKLPEWSGTSPGGSELSTPGQLSRAGNSRRRRFKLCKEHTFKLAKDWSQFHSDCPFNSSPKMKLFSFGLLIHTNYSSHF